jgi:hypothetical protein
VSNRAADERGRIDGRLLAAVVAFAAIVGFVVVAVARDQGQPAPPATDLRNGRVFIQDNLWTEGDEQYATWVDPGGVPYVGKRVSGSDDWEVVDLAGLAGNPLGAPTVDDEHRVHVVGVDSLGHVHVVGNVHSTPLRYVRSAAPGDISAWESAEMAGPVERVAYPRFVKLGDGTLLFFRREGEAGFGAIELDELAPGETEWRHVGTVLDGRPTDENPYLHQVAVDPASGAIHVLFVWREGQLEPQTTADLGYARSDDGGRTWRTSDGRDLALPITHDTAETVLDTVPSGSGLVNQGGLALDPSGRPHGVVLFAPPGGERSLRHVWHDGERWEVERLDGGLVEGRPSIAVTADGRRWLLGVRGGEMRAIELTGRGTGTERPAGRVPSGWEVTFDSRALAANDRLEVLVPDGDTPEVVRFPIGADDGSG